MTHAYLLIVTPGPETRFDQEPEFFKRELQAFTEQLMKFHSRGQVSAVECFHMTAESRSRIDIPIGKPM